MLLAFRPSVSIPMKRFSRSGIQLITGMDMVAATPVGVARMRKKSGMRLTLSDIERIQTLLSHKLPAAFIMTESQLKTVPGIQLMVELMMHYPAVPVLLEINRNSMEESTERLLRLGIAGLYIRKEPKWFSTWPGILEPPPMPHAKQLEILKLRKQVDLIDEELVDRLIQRMETTAQLGQIKVEYRQQVFQSARWKEVMQQLLEASDDADTLSLLHSVFALVHACAIAQQTNGSISGK